MTLSDTKDIAIIIGTVVAVLTLIKAVIEYTKQNAQKRAEHYSRLREEFKKDGRFGDLFEKLEDDSPELAALSFEKKQDIIGFYEDEAQRKLAGDEITGDRSPQSTSPERAIDVTDLSPFQGLGV